MEYHVGVILSFFALGYIAGSTVAAAMYTPRDDDAEQSRSLTNTPREGEDEDEEKDEEGHIPKENSELTRLKVIMLAFGIIQVASSVIMALSKTYWALCLGRFLQGAATGAFWVISLSYLGFFFKTSQMGRVTSVLLACNSVSVYAGATVGGFFYEMFGYTGPFVCLIVLGLVDVALRLAMSSTTESPELDQSEQQQLLPPESTTTAATLPKSSKLSTRIYSLLSNVPFMIIILQESLIEILASSMEAVLSIHLLKPPFTLSPSFIGLVFLFAGLPELVFGPISGFVYDRYGFAWTSLPGLLLCIIPLAILSSPNLPLAIFVTCICFLCGLQCYANAAILPEISRLISAKDQPTAFAVYNIVYALGLWIGPLVSGFVYAAFGFSVYVYAYISLLVVVVILAIMKIAF